MPRRLLLILPTSSYKATDFLEAAGRLGVDVVVGTDRRQALEDVVPGHALVLDFARPEHSLRRIVQAHERQPFDAVVAADDETTVLAAEAGKALGLPHNPVAAARASRDKHETRKLLSAAGLRSPRFLRIPVDGRVEDVADELEFPCVVKPLHLSASQGVLRADDLPSLVQAFERVRAIVADPARRGKVGDRKHLLVESYLPGCEVAFEGMLDGGHLRRLALFDKPDPLEGPTFAETLFVTPSRLDPAVQVRIQDEVDRACRALGLVEGPIHAELRIHEDVPWMLEVAARTIGGLCARTLRFGPGVSLEELVLRHALGLDTSQLVRDERAAGVMMLPVERAGVLRGVTGIEHARDLEFVEEITMTVQRGTEVVPLPEGNRYLGFIFARADTPPAVEAALRRAYHHLRITIEHRGHSDFGF